MIKAKERNDVNKYSIHSFTRRCYDISKVLYDQCLDWSRIDFWFIVQTKQKEAHTKHVFQTMMHLC